MKHDVSRAVVSSVLALACCLGARADIVYLTDGTIVEGEVTYVGNMVKIRKTSGITVTHPKHAVRRVKKSVSAAAEYRKRSETVEPDDARGLLDLARWCAGKKKLDTEAEAAYRAVLGIASPVFREAKREFAGLLRRKKRLGEAYRLYSELGDGAAREAAAVRTQLEKQMAGAYDKGMRCLLAKDRRGALMEFERSLRLAPEGDSVGKGSLSEAEILAKIVVVRQESVEASRPPAVVMRPCAVCTGTGLVDCGTCGGEGRVRRLTNVMTKSGVDMQYRLFTCDACRGGAKVRCSSCGGASIGCTRLGPTASDVKSIGAAAASSSKSPVAKAVKRMNQTAVKRRMAFAPGKAPYPESRDLRKLLPGVPAAADELKPLRAPWRDADAAQRMNFLANYVLESAELLSRFSVSAYKVPADAAQLGLEAAEMGDATRLSAFPQESAGEACRIPCVWKAAADGGADIHCTDLSVETDGPHTLHPFIWKDQARPAMERLGGVLGLPGLATRAAAYPFGGLAETIQARKEGDRVELVGRLLYDRDPAPAWRFEVWRIVPRLDEATERMVEILSRRVSFRFADTPLDAAAEMLSDLTGARIKVDVPPDAGVRVTSRARKLPLGHALDQMLGGLKLGWRFGEVDAKMIRIVERTSRAERARVKELLGLIPPAGK